MQSISKNIKASLRGKSSNDLTVAFITFDTNYAKNIMVQLNKKSFLKRIKNIFSRDLTIFSLKRGDE